MRPPVVRVRHAFPAHTSSCSTSSCNPHPVLREISIEVDLLQQTLASEIRSIKRTTASSKSSVLRAAFGRMQNSTRGLRLHVVAAHKFLRRGSTKPFDNLKAERDAGFCNVNQHPKLSPDLNAIEGWWRVLQQRLSLTAPAELESRGDFLK